MSRAKACGTLAALWKIIEKIVHEREKYRFNDVPNFSAFFKGFLKLRSYGKRNLINIATY